MKRLLGFYRTLNWLSIDVSIGAVVGTLFFAKHLQIFVPWPSLLSLSCTVWIIYTVDHLMDVRQLKDDASTERHRFHQKYFKNLVIWVFAIITIDAIALFFMPLRTIQYGIGLAVIVAAYALLHKKLSVAKEFCVAALYVSGIAVPVISLQAFVAVELMIAFIYFLIAFTNLVLFSLQDKESDLKDGYRSIATILNLTMIRVLLSFLFVTTAILCYIHYTKFDDTEASMIFISMSAVLLLIYLARDPLKANGWFRILGDLVFIFPVLYLI